MALKLTTFALVLGVAAVSLPALAQQAPETRRGNETLKKYCTGDYFKHCGDIDPDSPAMDACFEKNWKALSENCRRAIDAYQPAQGQKGGKRG